MENGDEKNNTDIIGVTIFVYLIDKGIGFIEYYNNNRNIL